jgi:hypothetical protein
MKRGKEVKLQTNYQYNVISGTVDNKQPKTIYLQISAWGKPKNKYIDNYEGIIRSKSKRVKRKLFELLDENDFYVKNSIVDFNMASSGIGYDKRSFMSVELTLFKKEPLIPINSKEMLPKIEYISEKIITDVFEKDEDFEFFKTKSDKNGDS